MQITNNPLNFKDKSILFLKDLITFGSRHRVNEWYLKQLVIAGSRELSNRWRQLQLHES